jgi:hypothetical protein
MRFPGCNGQKCASISVFFRIEPETNISILNQKKRWLIDHSKWILENGEKKTTIDGFVIRFCKSKGKKKKFSIILTFYL